MPQPEVEHSGTAAAGDALTCNDSENETSALGYSLLKRVLVGLGHPCRATGQVLGQGKRRKRNGTMVDLWRGKNQSRKRREQEYLPYCTDDGVHT